MTEIPRWRLTGDWFGFKSEFRGTSSKHIPFDWTGPGST